MKTIVTAIILTVSLLNANATTSAQLVKRDYFKHAAHKAQTGKASRVKLSDEKDKAATPTVTTNILYGRF